MNFSRISMLKSGLYEQVVDSNLERELNSIPEQRKNVSPVDAAETSKVLAQYLSNLIQKELENLSETNPSKQIDIANKVIELVRHDNSFCVMTDEEKKVRQLMGILDEHDPLLALNKTAKDLVRPETSVAQSSLFTGAAYEPQMFLELKKEIASCDRIDMLVSFIKWTGLRLLIDDLKKFTQRGGRLRVITTSYMGATDVRAIEELRQLTNTTIKVSYDTKRTRLHAKTYVFYRDTGFTTAYVGSSNMSNAALSSGLEWNVKATAKDLPETIDKINATFETYWNSSDFEEYSEGMKQRLVAAIKQERHHGESNANVYFLDVTPYSYQQEVLDKLSAERSIRSHYKNLVVAATGTGKTVISAFDYKRFKDDAVNRGKPCKLLFIAHREEILKQSLATFRAVLRDSNFGDLFDGHHRPEQIDYLFMSIQTFNSQDFANITAEDYYDFIIVDEFHHAAAPSYDNLLQHYNPKILLGLTATPERMDGRSVLPFFDNRIAAEIRLPEAINRKLLCPFQYFGVTDTVNLDDLRWTAGGYDKTELSNIYTISGMVAERRAQRVIESLLHYVNEIEEVKGLGFCVSVEHAKFMADFFNEHNIKSMCLTGNSPDDERNSAKQRLVSGEIKFIFVVDIYNEGVDIPEVNTVLFLRPTESLTVFLQQLGRGLRLADNKECLTVLDFIGQAHKKYNFETKFAALLNNTRRSVQHHIEHGFTALPKGCYVQLEKQAAKYILENIKASLRINSVFTARIRTFEDDSGKELTLGNFLDYYQIKPENIYKSSTFSQLCINAGVREIYHDVLDDKASAILYRLAKIDSRRWIDFLLTILPNIRGINFVTITDIEQKFLQMFYITVFGKAANSQMDEETCENIQKLIDSPMLVAEMIELLKYQKEQIDFIDKPVDIGYVCPLDLHCSYSRDQILVALDFMSVSSVREGVKWLEQKKTDVFFVTLNKSEKDYSPTTMYKDYSINETLFHWQSQSGTTIASATGQRYIHHREQGSKVLLFVREFKKDSFNGTATYTYLGKVNYVKHDGECPMNIVWQLEEPIPAKYVKQTNKLIGN